MFGVEVVLNTDGALWHARVSTVDTCDGTYRNVPLLYQVDTTVWATALWAYRNMFPVCCALLRVSADSTNCYSIYYMNTALFHIEVEFGETLVVRLCRPTSRRSPSAVYIAIRAGSGQESERLFFGNWSWYFAHVFYCMSPVSRLVNRFLFLFLQIFWRLFGCLDL